MASRVGKYLLFETLGEGAFGKVKLGVHEETGEQVAVKIMDKSDIKAQEMTMNVRREIAIMKALKHRNIVNLRCVLTSNSKLYIVMDVVSGGELFTKILNEGKLDEEVARRYFQQLVDGVEYCHRRGVCHRDLKPENLLIDSDSGELKITDFGLSAMRGADTTEALLHTQCGSPNYCAPEIIARHKEGYNGAKVDAWSCGIILFALLAGFLPFYDENTKVLYRMIQKEDVKFPRRFPPDAKDLVLRLLHKEPDKRINLVDVKKHPWFVHDYVGDDSATHAVTPVMSPPVTKRKRRGHSRRPSQDVSATATAAAQENALAAAPDVGPPGAGVGAGPEQPPSTAAAAAVAPSAAAAAIAAAAAAAQATAAQTAAPAPPPPGAPPPYGQQPGYSSGYPPYQQAARPQGVPAYGRTHIQPGSGGVPYYNPPPVSGNGPPHAGPPHYMQASPMERYQQQRASANQSQNQNHMQQQQQQQQQQQHQLYQSQAGGYGAYRPPQHVSSPPSYAQPPPPPPSYQPPHTNRQSAPAVVSPAPPSYAAPVSPYVPTRSSEVTPSPSMEFAVPPPVRPMMMNGSSFKRGMDSVPSYASLSGGGSDVTGSSFRNTGPSGSRDSAGSSNGTGPPSSYFPPAPPFPTAEMEGGGHDSGADRQMPKSPPSPASMPKSPPPPPPSVPLSPPSSGNESGPQRPRSVAVPPPHKSSPSGGRIVQDSAWQKQSNDSPDAVPLSTSRPVSAPAAPAAPAPPVEPATDSEPMSMVERRRLMFNQMAGGGGGNGVTTTAVPKPSSPETSPAVGATVPSMDEKIGDREEAAPPSRWTPSVPTTAAPAPVTTPVPTSGAGEVKDEGGDISDGDTRDEEMMDEPPAEDGEFDYLAVAKIPTKKRLSAALARYRRIFQLRASVGITSSPSFGMKNSTGGGSFLDSSACDLRLDEGKETGNNHSPQERFFARAKAVTGAWGVILTQELEDLDESDEETVLKEDELQAFGRLLDFWDRRRTTAGQSISLDDHETVPMSEAEISDILALLQTLEPSAVDGVEEVEGSGETEDGDADEEAGATGADEGSAEKNEEYDAEETRGLIERDFSDLNVSEDLDREDDRSSNATSSRGPASGEPFSGGAFSGERAAPAAPVASANPQPSDPFDLTASTVRDPYRPGTGSIVGLPPHYPSGLPISGNKQSSPKSSSPIAPPLPPAGAALPPHAGSKFGVSRPRRPTVSFDQASALENTGPPMADLSVPNGSVIPSSKSVDADLHTMTAARKSSHGQSSGSLNERAHTEHGPKQSDADRSKHRVNSSASGHSDDSSRYSGRDFDPAVAQKGMFGFGVFSRRPAVTSFDSGLEPHRCLVEVGRILTGMGCHVLMKKGETKMKSEVPVRSKDKMLVSITCTRVSGISTVTFKRGRKDRSRADSNEFHDFVDTVSSRFADRSRAGQAAIQ